MSKSRSGAGRNGPEAFQQALDTHDLIGRWEWDASTDRARVDGLVAMLFGVDPGEASGGLPFSLFLDRIHHEDRDQVLARIRQCRRDGSVYLAEYRVLSVDGQIRWLLDRGRFTVDHYDRPIGGAGILVDITELRTSNSAFSEPKAQATQEPLNRAAEHAIAAHRAIVELRDPLLQMTADALLMALGHALARQEAQERRRLLN